MAVYKRKAQGKRKKKSGTARMIEQGYHAVQLWLDQKEFEATKRAADADGRPLATWIRRVAYNKATGENART